MIDLDDINDIGNACSLTEPVTFFAVFDGHAGSLVADLACETLPEIVKFRLSQGEDPVRAMVNAFIEMGGAAAAVPCVVKIRHEPQDVYGKADG